MGCPLRNRFHATCRLAPILQSAPTSYRFALSAGRKYIKKGGFATGAFCQKRPQDRGGNKGNKASSDQNAPGPRHLAGGHTKISSRNASVFNEVSEADDVDFNSDNWATAVRGEDVDYKQVSVEHSRNKKQRSKRRKACYFS